MTGRVIAGRYQLVEPIGRGTMGVVWRATDQLLDRDVAIKEVRFNDALGDVERANAYKRTLREARTAARLSHRAVVTVFDVVEEKGRPWIVMELIRSRSLDDMLETDGPMPPRRVARIAQQLLSALAHAHSSGVLHRDVKPSNVLIATGGADERAVLTDFGIAQFEGDSRLTQTGMVMGSPGFTAPERIRGATATPASDLWSLGATLFAACEGQGPYEQRGGPITTMTAIINEDAPVIPSADRLGPVISALLRRDPARRPSASIAANMIAQVLPSLQEQRVGQRIATKLPSSNGSKAAADATLAPPAPVPPSDPAVTGVDTPATPGAAPASVPPDANAVAASVPDDQAAEAGHSGGSPSALQAASAGEAGAGQTLHEEWPKAAPPAEAAVAEAEAGSASAAVPAAAESDAAAADEASAPPGESDATAETPLADASTPGLTTSGGEARHPAAAVEAEMASTLPPSMSAGAVAAHDVDKTVNAQEAVMQRASSKWANSARPTGSAAPDPGAWWSSAYQSSARTAAPQAAQPYAPAAYAAAPAQPGPVYSRPQPEHYPSAKATPPPLRQQYPPATASQKRSHRGLTILLVLLAIVASAATGVAIAFLTKHNDSTSSASASSWRTTSPSGPASVLAVPPPAKNSGVSELRKRG